MKTRTREDYRAAERAGRLAELACRLALRLRGYRILAVRCRTPAGEIDLVARRGDLLAIVEVKARPSLEQARAAVTHAQWRRLARAAGLYVGARRGLERCAVRFDLVAVVPGRWPVHLPDAWRPEG
ncbi:MAG TPA: YraN family protein [Azospirillaceae bacterium]|nr:YraN family protein [Azospirillaceae bacterium]